MTSAMGVVEGIVAAVVNGADPRRENTQRRAFPWPSLYADDDAAAGIVI